MSTLVRITGLDELMGQFRSSPDVVLKAAGAACYGVANNAMTAALPMTPKDTGDLRASQYVKPPQTSTTSTSVELGFGGPSADYAERVHEMTGAVNWQEPGTGPKFLEKAVAAQVSTFPSEFARIMRAQLEAHFRK